MAAPIARGGPRWIVLALAVLLLNAALTFDNLWPTPAIWWRGRLSIELAVFVMAAALAVRRTGPLSRAAIRGLSALWTLLVLGRYADVTARALYGREIDLYWDLRFVPDVAAMVTTVAPVWLVAVSLAAIALALSLLFVVVRWALARLADGVSRAGERRALLAAASIVVALFGVEHTGLFAANRAAWDDPDPIVPAPVTGTYARQLRLLAHALGGSTSLPASPAMDGDLARVKDADVYLIFIESYGGVSFDRPAIAGALAPRRAALDAAIRETGRGVVSASVESPTFGGGSWLAHISLLSGIEVRDPDTNAKLMAAKRDTMVRAFGRRGYRTVGLMPGMRQSWPEGAFYGFDDIYSAARLEYHGPEFGWFAIPDQYSLAKFDALDAAKTSRPPLFVFFPTISTHFPFVPTPPYQPDWGRMLAASRQFDGGDIVRAYERERVMDWVDFIPGYVDAIGYDLETIAGYLRLRPSCDLVMILIGDHQPPALVSGAGANWNVPVHIVANRADVLDRLAARGFHRGLTPSGPGLGRMHTLLPVLLDAFSGSRE